MKKTVLAFVGGILGLTLMASPVFAVASFFNGFEVDTTGWNDFGGTTTRVATGTDGIPSSDGAFHGVIDGSVFTRWGGYESAFPTDGYTTEIDVYLDMSEADGTDKRFDFSSAINRPDGTHRRDFIFHLGTNPSVVGQWAGSASNNAPGWPLNPARNPVDITETGWYTLRHTFQDDGTGVLEVILDLLDSNGVVVGTWTLSDPSDVIGTTVGGNRYGWFTSQRFDFDSLAIDNSAKNDIIPLIGPPTYKNECKKGGWMTFNNPTFKNQGDCVSYVQSNSQANKDN